MACQSTHLELPEDLSADLVFDIESNGLLGHDDVRPVVAHSTHHAPVARTQLRDLGEVLGVELVDVLLGTQEFLNPLTLTVVQLLVVELALPLIWNGIMLITY